MSGALIQLVAHSPNFGNTNDLYACEYTQLFFENNHNLLVTRNADTCNFKNLIFKTQTAMTSSEFINSLGSSTFNLEIGGSTILSNRLELYTKLNPIKQIDSNIFIVEIPWNKFNDDLYLIALQYHEIRCRLQFTNPNFISESSLLVEYIYLDSDRRRNLAQNGHEKPVQLFQSQYINLNQPSNQIVSRLGFDLLSKGIIIDTDINNINNIKLTFNGHERWNYNKVMLRLLSKNIGPNLYYIPFDSNVDIFDKNVNSFRSGTNFSRIDTTIMTINFDNPVQTIGFHSLFLNFLRYHSGMGRMKFSVGNFIDLQTENYNSNTINNLINKLSPIGNKIVWKYLDKLLDTTRNTSCPITYDEIKSNDKYCFCTECKYNFSGTIFKEYIEGAINKRCSMCRSQWTNWTIYTNKNPDIDTTNNDNVLVANVKLTPIQVQH
jgi:hypothetical protein